MKKFINYFLLAAILPALIITGCKDNTDPVPAEKGNFETLKSYMVANDLDLLGDQLLASWVIAPKLTTDGGIVEPDVNTIPTYHVFDIRSADDFNAGHIPGAINVALVDIVTFAADYSDKPILVVCKTGQTAGRGTMALRLSGFPDAKVMKFGMSYWNATYDLWTGNIGNLADGSANWTTDATAGTLPVNDFPQWETTSTDGAEILAANVDAMLNASGWGVNGADVLADPAAYNIYNFWVEEDYLTFGHFTGAYQLNPISLANDVVYALPTSDECLIYCFTGQTSSFATAWLQVLGYNAKSILFGVNKLKYDELDAASKPAWHHSFDYVSE